VGWQVTSSFDGFLVRTVLDSSHFSFDFDCCTDVMPRHEIFGDVDFVQEKDTRGRSSASDHEPTQTSSVVLWDYNLTQRISFIVVSINIAAC
jgi:hypothetical protein